MSAKASFWKRRWLRRIVSLIVLLVIASITQRVFFGPPRIDPGSYVLLNLEGEIDEAPGDPLLAALTGRIVLSLFDTIEVIRDAQLDERIHGLIVRVGTLDVGWGKAQDVRDALLEFRKSKKRLIALLDEDLVGSTLEYYVASAASEVYLPPAANAPVTGLLAEVSFLGGLWEKLDVEMQVEQRGAYKSAAEVIAGKKMSASHREMLNWLLDSVYTQLIDGVSASRFLEPEAVKAAIDRAPMTAKELKEAGFVDGERYLTAIADELLGEDEAFVSAEDYHRAGGWVPREISDKRLALIYGVGPITTGESREGAIDGSTMGADTIIEAFEEAATDDRIAAIVFRVDSPGGSALASDLIWESVSRARDRKPVIVSMADVAASGGYYVSASGTKIFAQPGTITGSIGVVLTKPNVRGLLEKIGVHTETLQRGELARLSSMVNSLSGPERERVASAMENVYETFIDRVAESRDLTRDEVRAVAEGRVWTGAQAAQRGLIDKLGGFFAALDEAKKAAGIPPAQGVRLVLYPRPRPLFQRIGRLLDARVANELPAWWRRLRDVISVYEYPEGSILAMMPFRIRIR